MRIAICIRDYNNMLDKKFALSVLDIVSQFYEWRKLKGRDDTLSIIPAPEKVFSLEEISNKIVIKALEIDATHLLFLDSDQMFMAQTIPFMIKDFEDNPEAEAITGLYHRAVPPYLPQLFLKKNNGKFGIVSEFPLNGIFKIDGTGLGIVMIKADVFKRIKLPYFKFMKAGEDKNFPNGLGEDLYFFNKAKPFMLCDSRIQSLHHRQDLWIGPKHYVDENRLKVEKKNGTIKMTDKQRNEIANKS